jgi:hypothetical protein
MAPVPVLAAPERSAIEAHGAQPFVMRDAAIKRDTGAWTSDFIRQRLGDMPVNVYVSANGTFPGGKGPYDPTQYRGQSMPLAECLDRMAGVDAPRFFNDAERYYLYQAPAVQFDGLVEDIDLSRYMSDEVVSRNFWLSGAGNITPIHYDMVDNYLVQLMGRKRVLLWAPSHYDKLEFNPIGTTHDRQSRIDPTQRDGSAWPAVPALPVYVHDLIPGDVLYIPYAWPHFVYTEQFSASINFWWNPGEITRLLQAVSQAESPLEQAGLIHQYLGAHRPELQPMLAGLAADGSLDILLSRG